MDTTTRTDRVLLAWEALVLKGERQGFITDSTVLDVIDAWTTGSCGSTSDTAVCTSDHCCDYQRLSFLLWDLVEQAQP